MKIRIKKKPELIRNQVVVEQEVSEVTTEDILTMATYLREHGSPILTSTEVAARAYGDDKPVKEDGGSLWHLSLFRRSDGILKTYCGATIKEPFMNFHPGKERCSSCYLNGYPGDGNVRAEGSKEEDGIDLGELYPVKESE